MKNLLAVSVLSLPLLLSPAAADKKYPIKLSRDYEIGQKHSISAIAKESNKMKLEVDGVSQPAPAGQNRTIQAAIEAVEEVLEVKDGSRLKSQLLILSLTNLHPGKKEESVLDHGTVVQVNFGEGKVKFELDGKAAGPEVAEILAKFFEPGREGNKDDKILGTGEKQAVGDKWKINRKAAAESLAESGMQLNEEDIDGWMELVGVVEKNGKGYLDIRGEIELKKMTPPMPPGIEILESGGKMTVGGLFPIDGVSQPSRKSMTLGFKIKAVGETDATDVELEIEGEKSRETRLKPAG